MTGGEEEEYLTVIKPSEMGLLNYIDFNTVIVHYAFFRQRDFLDKTNILNKYAKLIKKTYQENTSFLAIYDQIQTIYQVIENQGKGVKEKSFSTVIKKVLNKFLSVNHRLYDS